MSGGFDDALHPRDDQGRFTSEGGGASLARKLGRGVGRVKHGIESGVHALTKQAIKLGQRVDALRPHIGDKGEVHSDHAHDLRDVAKAHLLAAEAHNAAAAQARKDGNPDKAKEHAAAAMVHATAARERNHEADEHAAIGHTDKEAHAKEHDDVAKVAHDQADEAHHHHDKADLDKEHNKPNEEPGEREKEKPGLAEWIKEKLEKAKETVGEKGDEAKELVEHATEGDIYKAGGEALEAGGKFAVNQALKKATGGSVARFAYKFANKGEEEKKKE